jgi:CRP/FNR family cyclic AMP-dependent transcriptional regulator
MIPSKNEVGHSGGDSLALTQVFQRATKAPYVQFKSQATFDAHVYLESAGVSKRVVRLENKQNIFCQGDPAHGVMYIRKGEVKLTVVNGAGKEAVVAIFGPGDFFGEGCMLSETTRLSTATAITQTTLLVIEKDEMLRLLHREHEFSDRFMAHILARKLRAEEDLIDQLFNSSEKRLARKLLLLARYNNHPQEKPQMVLLPKISQEMLAGMVGTTRSRVNFFMNKFRKLGFIKYTGGLQINSSLLSVLLHD